SRRLDYDLLRVLSMFAVIYLHTAAGALREPQNVAVWQFSNVLTALATAAVPIFFMLSGSLLLGSEKTADLSYLLKKRLPKVLVPLLCWSALSIALVGLRGDWPTALAKLPPLLNTPALVPYWFVYALIPLYLLSPMLKKMVDGLTETHWRYLLVLWFGLSLGLHTLRAFAPPAWEVVFTEHWTLNINVVGGYLGYFLLGFYLEHHKPMPSRKLLWGAFAGLWALIALGTWYVTAATGAYDARFTDYLNVFTPLLAATIFLLAKSYLGEKQGRGRVLPALAGLSFGVYLLHPMAITLLREVWMALFHNPVDTVPEQILLYAAIALGCILGVLIFSSIRPLCYPLTGQGFSAACRESNLFALRPGKKH
ncbi:MAG: acyltransferase, partial [Pseudoflavonifractor sp.]